MSKPMLMTLPFLFLLLDIWPLRRLSAHPFDFSMFRKLSAEKSILFLCAIASALTGLRSRDLMGLNIHVIPQIPLHYLAYLKDILFPVRIIVAYPPEPYIAWQNVLTTIVLLLITIFICRSIKRKPYLFVGWFWFLIALVPVITMYNSNRFTYLPMIGFFIMATWGICQAANTRPQLKRLLPTLAVLTISLTVIWSYKHVGYWKNGTRLFQHALSVTENNFSAHYGLAAHFTAKGRIDDALLHYKKALEVIPNHADANNNFGNILFRQGRDEEAMTYYQKALALEPAHVKVINNIGTALLKQNNHTAALFLFLQAVELEPDFAEGHYNIGIVMKQTRDFEKAKKRFERALEIDSHFWDAHKKLAHILALQGNFVAAIAHYMSVLNVNEFDFEAHNNLGLTLAALDRHEEATKHYEAALEINANIPETHNNFANSLLVLGKKGEAMKHYELALQIKPDYPAAKQNLQVLKSQTT